MLKHVHILTMVLLGILTTQDVQSQDKSCDLAWDIYAPVTYMADNQLHYTKTYFFDANPNSQTAEDVAKLKQKNDSVAKISIGKVFMHETEENNGLSKSTWYWWPVQEQDKTYLLAYIHPVSAGVAPHSYYEFLFADGTKLRWTEPHGSPYNYNGMFILTDGSMEAYNPKTQTHYTIDANKTLHDKMLKTPLYVVTKYNGYENPDNADIAYEPVLQYVFSEKEGIQVMNTLRCMKSNTNTNLGNKTATAN